MSKGRAGQGRGGEEERGVRRGRRWEWGGDYWIIVLEDCQVRTLDPPLHTAVLLQ